MRRFRYALDPVCLAACAAYAVNRWLTAGVPKGAFLRFHFNDTLFIPAALPLVLWVHRRLGFRADDAPPRWGEIWLHVALWSLATEVLAPLVLKQATGDVWDAAAYAGGALVSGLLWHRA